MGDPKLVEYVRVKGRHVCNDKLCEDYALYDVSEDVLLGIQSVRSLHAVAGLVESRHHKLLVYGIKGRLEWHYDKSKRLTQECLGVPSCLGF